MSNPPAPLAADGRTSLLWNQNGNANTVDEALNQREFEAARQQWLNSADQKQQPRGNSASGVQSKVLTSSSAVKKKVPDRADMLLKETKKMDARLAILRASMEAEKGKRQAAMTASPGTKQPRVKRASNPISLAPSTNSMTLNGTSTGSLAATLIAPSLASNRPAASASSVYKHVAPKVDMQNTFLQVKETVEREKREARAKATREKEAEAKRLAELKAKGHTLLTYAAAEPAQKWVLHREEDEVAARETAISDVGVSLRGAPAAASVRAGARKAVTAADMMRMKRGASASKQHNSQNFMAPQVTAAPAHATVAPSAAASSVSSSTIIDRSRFNLMASPAAATTSTETTAGSSLLDGDFDEAANAAEFAAAREEFLRSLQQPSANDESLDVTQKLSSISSATSDSTTTNDSSSIPSSSTSSFEPFSSALPSNWWERSESEEAEANASAVAGSLWDGPAFDEADSAAAFQAARQQWIQQEESNSSTNIKSPQANAAVSTKLNPAANNSTAAPAKTSCYTCYKQFFTKEGGVQCSETQRWYCTDACLASDHAQRIEKCVGCTKKIRRKDAKPTNEGWRCERCATEKDTAQISDEAAANTATVSSDAPAGDNGDEPLVELFGAASFTASLAAREWKPKETKTVKFATPATPELRADPRVDLAESEISAWGDQ